MFVYVPASKLDHSTCQMLVDGEREEKEEDMEVEEVNGIQSSIKFALESLIILIGA